MKKTHILLIALILLVCLTGCRIPVNKNGEAIVWKEYWDNHPKTPKLIGYTWEYNGPGPGKRTYIYEY